VAAAAAPAARGASRRDLAAVALGAAALLLPRLGAGSLRDWDEAIYAQVAREILASGDWLTLHYDGAPWFLKPPLAFWATALGFQAFGIGELAPRLLQALCGIALAVLMLAFGARAFGVREGRLAALVLLGTPPFLALSRMGMLDVPLSLASAAALVAWWRAAREPRWLVVAGAALGVAVMLKGVAGLPPALAAALHALLCGRLGALRSRWFWLGALAALALAAPWHVQQWMLWREAFARSYLGYHVLDRAGLAIEGHDTGPLFYLRVLAWDARPWGLVGLVALAAGARRFVRTRDDALGLVLAWAVVALAVPTAMRTRIDWYIAPAYPALALASAVWLLRVVPASRHRWVWAVAALALAANLATKDRLRNPDYSPGAKGLAAAVQAHVRPGGRLCAYRIGPPALRFYAERRVVHVRGPEDPRWGRLRPRPVLCATRDEHLPELAPFGPREIARAADLRLVALDRAPATPREDARRP
jgi:4-amino-4-deoxy-L-arabinose transferase-like glycosyltransferase